MSENPLLDRRKFLIGSSMFAGSLFPAGKLSFATPKPDIKAIAFDAFPIFDPRPIFKLAETLITERGEEFVKVWRAKQFEYTWLRALSGRYADFWSVTEDALAYAAKLLQLEMSEHMRSQLMSGYLQLKPWPDVPDALVRLKAAGFDLAFLSNFTPVMLNAGIESAGLEGVFSYALSTDMVKSYKPAPHTYQLGVDALGVPREEILFVAFAGWDAAGAKAFGYPTFWVNRLNQPPEELGELPDGTGTDLTDLVRFLGV